MGRWVKFLEFNCVDRMQNELYILPRHCESLLYKLQFDVYYNIGHYNIL